MELAVVPHHMPTNTLHIHTHLIPAQTIQITTAIMGLTITDQITLDLLDTPEPIDTILMVPLQPILVHTWGIELLVMLDKEDLLMELIALIAQPTLELSIPMPDVFQTHVPASIQSSLPMVLATCAPLQKSQTHPEEAALCQRPIMVTVISTTTHQHTLIMDHILLDQHQLPLPSPEPVVLPNTTEVMDTASTVHHTPEHSWEIPSANITSVQ